MILVTGATGTVGGALVDQLVAAGHPVRGLTRSPEKAARLGSRAEMVVGDLDDPETLGPAFDGVDAVFLVTGRTAQDAHAIAAARAAGVRRLVKLSTQEAGWTPVEGHGHWHREREALIEASGIPFTFLRPSMFMTQLFAFAREIRASGAMPVAGGDGRLAPVDPADVAAVAAVALTEAGHEGRGYELTGPELLSFGEMAAVLTRVLGRPVRHQDLTDAEEAASLAGAGLPRYVVDGLVETFSLIRAGRFAYLTGDVAAVTGRPPEPLEAWARAHGGAFA